MPPNIFHYATSELSQDALLCWLLSWSKESHGNKNKDLHGIGKRFLDVLFEISGLEAPQIINELEIKRQEGGIDVLAIINNEKVVLIEDKTGTQEHSDQLARYLNHVVENLGVDEENIIPIYIQTGDQSDFEEVARNGYSVLDRKMFLRRVLESEIAVQARVRSDVLNDYATWLREIEDDVQSFRNTPPTDWSWNAWKGFYAWLQNTLHTGNWDYVANPTGGFLGFWWHYVDIEQGEIYLQIEQENFCFKIWVKQPSERTIQRQHFHEQVMLHCQEQEITARRPQRFGYGQCMTVAILDQKFPVVADTGLIDLEATLAVIHAAQIVVDTCE